MNCDSGARTTDPFRRNLSSHTGIRNIRWRIANGALSPVRENPHNPFPAKFITNSKRWNFENRIESVKSRASERNGPFGEQ